MTRLELVETDESGNVLATYLTSTAESGLQESRVDVIVRDELAHLVERAADGIIA